MTPWNKGKKGVQVAWNKGLKGLNSGNKNPFWGKKHTLEVLEKNKLAHLGKKASTETKEKMSQSLKGLNTWTKGRVVSEETKNKISIGNLGKKRGPMSEQGRINISLSHKGLKPTKEALEKRTKSLPRGKDHYWWKGGITPLNHKIRNSTEYKLWRKAVYKRDNYTCVWCRKRGIVLNADHIKPFFLYPELRFAIDNGRTLCIDCHKSTDTYGEKAKKYKN